MNARPKDVKRAIEAEMRQRAKADNLAVAEARKRMVLDRVRRPT